MKSVYIGIAILFVSVSACTTRLEKMPVEQTSSELTVTAQSWLQMILIPGGIFIQEELHWEEAPGPGFEHTISSFLLAQTEVRYIDWYEVRKWSEAEKGYVFANPGREGSDYLAEFKEGGAPTERQNEPVSSVSWFDVVVWCNALSEEETLEPVYYADASLMLVLKNAREAENELPAVFTKPDAGGYRLPTESQWQYAAVYTDGQNWTPATWPAGGNSIWYEGDSIEQTTWYESGGTRAVAGKQPTALGLYDMSGNLSEWCHDWYAPYPQGPVQDWQGPENGEFKVERGGAWAGDPVALQPGIRSFSVPGGAYGNIGFRPACNQ